jgi:DNA repair exonuclease SbcCD ATPase subunit
VKIRSITMAGFMCHSKADVDFPEAGLVLVTGPNGSGKSSFAEAVACAGWNHTLRGTPPWKEGVKGCVVVETDRFVLSRTRSAKGAAKLSWQRLDGEAFDFQTSQIAQDALEREIGSWDVWRRSSVFSSQDAAHFTLATDAERKHLIESLLGIDRFDAALQACRADMKTNAQLVQRAERDLAVQQAKSEGVAQRLRDAKAAVETFEDGPEPTGTATHPTELHEKDVRLSKMIADATQEVGELAGQLRAIDGKLATADAEVRQAQKRADFFAQDKCPTCEQALPQNKRNEASRALAKAQLAAREEKQRCEAERAAVEQDCAELREEVEALREQRRELAAELAAAQAEARALEQQRSAWRKAQAQREQAMGVLATAAEDLEAIAKRTAEVEAGLAQARAEAAELAAVERVLGLQGVRAQVLAKALGGIEGVANRWLADIAGTGLTMQLKPYTEKKTGGVNDKISLDVRGAGGGHGYRASSGGERRRIDVALLLALAEVAAAAQGREQGTLWFDEVFDALDEDGVEAVTSALAKLAQDRAVVVISHSRALVSKLRPVLRIRTGEAGIDARFV